MKIVQTNIRKFSHIRLNIDSLKIGDILVFDIFIKRKNNYVVIIEAGAVLSQNLYTKLQKQDLLYISKKDENKQELSYKTLYTYIKHNKNDLKKSLDFLYDINNQLFTEFLNSKEDLINLASLGEILKSIIFLVKDNQSYLKETIPHFSDNYELAYHSLHVSIYSISLGHFVHLNNEELLQLGTAGILHDLGYKKLNESIHNKDSKLSIEETEAIQQHSKYSSNIAKKNYIHDPYILDGILHHHECYDATGYPDHLGGKEISIFASIISISEVFDALTNNRSYRKKYSTFDALKIMMKEESMVNKFNQKYLTTFLKSFLK